MNEKSKTNAETALRSSAFQVPRGERGQALIIVASMMVGFFCVCGFVFDVGRVYIAYSQLQSSTDAAALAGAGAMGEGSGSSTTASVTAVVDLYGSQTAEKNQYGNLSTVTTTTTFHCWTTLAVPCYGAGAYNAIQVQQTTTVPMTFAHFFGAQPVTLVSTGTAEMGGGASVPYNVAIILDATLSQTSTDDNCGTGVTEMACEMNGVQVLLQDLVPCGGAAGNCTVVNGVAANTFDQVALFTFPAVSVGTVGINTNCTTPITAAGASQYGYAYSSSFGYYSMEPQAAWSGIASGVAYSFPTVGASSYAPASSPTSTPTYQVTPYLSDYRVSDTASTLNTNSDLVQALGGLSGCGGMLPPNYDGDIGTYYAGVLYAAQASLVAAKAANPNSSNVMIFLSDGDANAPRSGRYNGYTFTAMPSPANSSGSYPSYYNECQQAVTAAQYASSQGTRVYSIAYGSEQTGCSTDSSGLTPCATMQGIASTAGYFYSDYTQSGGGTDVNCVGTGATTTNLNQIFSNIYTSLHVARLLPNNTGALAGNVGN